MAHCQLQGQVMVCSQSELKGTEIPCLSKNPEIFKDCEVKGVDCKSESAEMTSGLLVHTAQHRRSEGNTA